MIHIHNGDVVTTLARRSDIPGEHLAFHESLVTGNPHPAARADALSEAYGEDLLRVHNDLFEQEQALDKAREQDEIVLWFEHDLYCLVHFVYLLQRFAGARLSCVWHPTPLGQCDERELHLAFDSRAAVTPAMLDIAAQVWRDYTSHDPSGLNRWIADATPDFPFLQRGITLHASRFPSRFNGLGAIEQQALTCSDLDSLFPKTEGFGFGDTELLRILRGMASCAAPLITLTETEGQPAKAIFAITPMGERVLAGEIDDVGVNDPDNWLGGVHLKKGNVWRFDGKALSR